MNFTTTFLQMEGFIEVTSRGELSLSTPFCFGVQILTIFEESLLGFFQKTKILY